MLHSDSCFDCEYDAASDQPVIEHSTDSSDIECLDDCSDLDDAQAIQDLDENSDLHNDSCDDCVDLTSIQPVIDFATESNQTECLDDCSDMDYGVADNAFPQQDVYGKSIGTSRSLEVEGSGRSNDQKENEQRVINFGTIFLTGSGDGNLIQDDETGPINLIEEDTMRPSLPPRRSRKLDLDEIPDYEDSVTVNQFSTDSSNFSGTNHADLVSQITKIQDKEVSSELPRRRGRMEDFDYFDNFDMEGIQEPPSLSTDDYDGETEAWPVRIGPRPRPITQPTAIQSVSVTPATSTLSLVQLPNSMSSNVQSSSSTSSMAPSTTSTVLNTQSSFQTANPKRCDSARECSVQLNERCVRKGPSTVCDCLEPLVRQAITGICVAKVPMDVSLRFPREEFDEDLKNPESERFKIMKNKTVHSFMLLLQSNPELLPFVTDITVVGFSPGSLVVDVNLVLADGNKSESELLQSVGDGLEVALNNDTLIEQLPLNAKDALLLTVTAPTDPCESPEMNYCSVNAQCIRNATHAGGYTCRCKDYYTEVAEDTLPGEVCELHCPDSFCGDNGRCEIKNETRFCLCRGWYFGDRCEISGIVVVATFSSNLALLVLIIFLVVVCKKRKHRSYGGQQHTVEEGIAREGSGRVFEVIAMEQNPGVKVAKFQNISTPLPVQNPPVITITHPTINESVISIDNDSTFSSDHSNATPSDQTSRIYCEVPVSS